MDYFTFIWDEDKDKLNRIKHGISFKEAEQVFYDEYMLYDLDLKHSNNEERFKALGMSEKPRLLMVIHCICDGFEIRIISARRATKQEEEAYENERRIRFFERS